MADQSMTADDHGDVKMYDLRLYVAGQAPKSLNAFANLKRICEQYLPHQHQIEVIDLVLHPQLAASDQILALPTLVRRLPPPVRRIIGDLSNTERVLAGLDLHSSDSARSDVHG